MGSPPAPAARGVLLALSLLALSAGGPPPAALAQDLRERDALCNADGCFAVFFQRRIFLDAWRSCKDKGGNLATVKRREEADTVAALFSGVELRGQRTKARVWIGLQRQPRQCTASRPLRGFSWTTGDQDTQYTNWLREDSPNTCSAPRCVVMGYGTAPHDQRDNFKWLDGSCSVPVDGYLCRFSYQGMCQAVWGEGDGNAVYLTPFGLRTTLLTHAPYGSVATVRCPAGANEEEQSVLCTLREDGMVGWTRDGPLCSDGGVPPPVPEEEEEESDGWCEGGDNGGCEHICLEAGSHYYCECSEGFQLGEDGESCLPADVCRGAPCEFECLPLPDGYRCACPEGYMLAPDERGCLDVDECLQSPCEQLCVNVPGTFECRCREGYRPSVDTGGRGGGGAEEGECQDVDECMGEDPCEHACENTPGSHVCHCHLGFSAPPEDPSRCQDTDECQIPGTCQQMCVNYEGGFECYCEEGYRLMSDHFSCRRIVQGEEEDDLPTPATPAYLPWVTDHPDPPMWDPQDPVYRWTPHQTNTDWPTEDDSLDWLTDPPRIESDVIWVTSAPQEEAVLPFHPAQALPTAEADYEEEGGYPRWEKPAFDPAQATPRVQTEDGLGEYPHWGEPAFHPVPQVTPTPETEDAAEAYTAWDTTDWRVPEPSTSPTDTPTPAPTPTADWYEDEEDDETTTSSSPLPTTTVSGGAWNWFWISPTPASQDPERTPPQQHWTDIPTESEYVPEVVPDPTTTTTTTAAAPSSSQFDTNVIEVGEEKEEEDYERVELPPSQEAVSLPPLAALTPPGQGMAVVVGEEEEAAPKGDGSSQKQGGSWLLVGLLVPLCIFIVVMVALGIVYCTRCAVQPRNKSATDCYHWISGAHDKQGAPGSGVKQSHV